MNPCRPKSGCVVGKSLARAGHLQFSYGKVFNNQDYLQNLKIRKRPALPHAKILQTLFLSVVSKPIFFYPQPMGALQPEKNSFVFQSRMNKVWSKQRKKAKVTFPLGSTHPSCLFTMELGRKTKLYRWKQGEASEYYTGQSLKYTAT